MAEPYLGEIRLLSFNFAPRNWAQANGQILPIQQNQALFSLCGTTYGGNGTTTFALPDLRGRAPMHAAPSFPQGQTAGEQTHTLQLTEIPLHTHIISTSSKTADLTSPGSNMQFATYAANQYFSEGASNLAPMNANNVGSAGGSQPHPNMQPYLALNFCIALSGVFPSRN
jgi:microcystin-dependent protein